MTTFQIRPGFLLIDTCRCAGGVHRKLKDTHTEVVNQGNGIARDYQGHVEIDHVQVKADMDKLVGAAKYIIGKKHGVATPLGCILDAEAVKAVDAELAPLKAEAERMNELARTEGSDRRCYVGYAPTQLMLDNEATALEIYRAIREKLSKLVAAFRSGDTKKVNTAVTGCKGVNKLAVGIQGDAVKFALDIIDVTREALHKALDEKQAPEAAGAALDLDAIEGAIAMFTPSDEIASDDSSGGAAPASDDDALGMTVAA
jgi:hypothetical protein